MRYSAPSTCSKSQSNLCRCAGHQFPWHHLPDTRRTTINVCHSATHARCRPAKVPACATRPQTVKKMLMYSAALVFCFSGLYSSTWPATYSSKTLFCMSCARSINPKPTLTLGSCYYVGAIGTTTGGGVSTTAWCHARLWYQAQRYSRLQHRLPSAMLYPRWYLHASKSIHQGFHKAAIPGRRL